MQYNSDFEKVGPSVEAFDSITHQIWLMDSRVLARSKMIRNCHIYQARNFPNLRSFQRNDVSDVVSCVFCISTQKSFYFGGKTLKSLGQEKSSELNLTFRQQLLLPQQLVKMELVLASEGDGDGGLEEEKGAASLLGAPLKGRSISTNSRS